MNDDEARNLFRSVGRIEGDIMRVEAKLDQLMSAIMPPELRTPPVKEPFINKTVDHFDRTITS